ncbi:MAG: hypothetical protein ACR2QW_15505 [bacterium]
MLSEITKNNLIKVIQGLSIAAIAAILVIPVAIAFFLILGYVFKPSEYGSPLESGWIVGVINWSFLAVPFGTIAVAAYGVPVVLLLRKFDKANLFTSTLAALIPTGIFGLYSGLVDASLFFGTVALVSAWTFWAVSRKTLVN